jgi:hypothetical protein
MKATEDTMTRGDQVKDGGMKNLRAREITIKFNSVSCYHMVEVMLRIAYDVERAFIVEGEHIVEYSPLRVRLKGLDNHQLCNVEKFKLP